MFMFTQINNFANVQDYFDIGRFNTRRSIIQRKDNASLPFLLTTIHLDELGQTFVVLLVVHLQYKDGNKTQDTS